MTRANEQEWEVTEIPIERTCPDCGQRRHVDCYGTRAARCDYCQEKGQDK